MKKRSTLYALWVVFLFCLQANAQNETINWYFGHNAGLNFDQNALNVLADGEMSTPAGSSTISDSNGNLLFYTNGNTVWNKNHEIMENGEDLGGDPNHIQSCIIIPKPNDSNTYYIFTTREVNSTSPPITRGLLYSTVEFSPGNPLGKITNKNRVIGNAPSSEKITAIHHADGESFWLIALTGQDSTLPDPKNTFNVYKIDRNGVTLPPIKYTTENDIVTLGAMKISPNGKKIAVASNTIDNITRFIFMYDFDKTNGTITESIKINPDTPFVKFLPIGIEFSPDSKYLYYTYTFNDNEICGIGQYNLEAQFLEDPKVFITYDQDRIYGAMQLANDGKIYVALNHGNDDGQESDYLGVIENPNEKGSLANYRPDAIMLSPGASKRGLPNFVQSYFASRIITEDVCVSDPFDFSAISYSNIQSIQWDFGDGNTSNLLTPNHTYNAPGRYTVKAELVVGSSTITVYKKVSAFALPTLTPNQELVQCDTDTDGIEVFNLFTIREQITDPNLEEELFFYLNNNDAVMDSNRIDDPQNFTNTVPNQVIYVRAVNENGCYEITSFTVRANFVQLGNISEMYTCEEIGNTAASPEGYFDMRQKRTSIRAELGLAPDIRLTFFESFLDAQTSVGEIDNNYLSHSRTLWVRAQDSNFSCNGIQSFNIVVNPKPTINLQDEYLICNIPSQHPPVIVSGDSSNDRFEWRDDTNQLLSIQQNFTLTDIGTYSLTSYKTSNGLLCSNTKTFTVVKPAPPVFSNLEILIDGNNLHVLAEIQGNSSYEFSLNGVDYVGSGSSHTFRNVSPGIQTVYVRDLNSCEPPVQKEIPIVGFPNFFSPNGDGINDYWNIKGVNDTFYKSIQIQLFNRYGKVVYVINDFQNQGWDGTYNGKKLDPNDYWFSALVIDVNDQIIKKTGHISLIRD
jgi:gliding motility-associated-like protein